MDNFTSEDFKIVLSTESEKIIISWQGKRREIDTKQSALLNYLNNLLDSLKGREVIIDLCKMTLMNSSAILCFSFFMNNLNNCGIKTEVRYDSQSVWQTISFRVIAKMAAKMDNIKIVQL